MTTILIGSMAAKQHFPDWREPKDVDFFTDGSRPHLVGEKCWHPAFVDYFNSDEFRAATPNELYTIKLSHAGWDVGSWEKHMVDAMDLKRRGCQIVPELYDLLYKVWEDKHGKKRVSLDQDKTEFFGDAVQRHYDHDSLHRSCAITPGAPLYERFLKSGSDVLMDMDAVWRSADDLKLTLFSEEIAATALERWVIPSGYKMSPGLAWKRATKKTIVSLTKGKASRFVAENYDHYSKPTYDYVGAHKANMHFLEEI